MFDTTINSSWDERSRRGWTTLTSFGLQALATAVLLLVPLLRPAGLPSFHTLSTPVSLGQPPSEPAPVRAHAASSPAPTHPTEMIFRRPSQLPFDAPSAVDEGPPQIANSGPYVPGAAGLGDPHGLNLFGNGSRPILPAAAPPATVAHPVRLSHMREGDLIRRVQPAYPDLARKARIQGQVVLQAMISKQGTIENLSVMEGHPMLVRAAIDAVSQWRYRPYILNGEPVEVATQITVNFSLAGN
jgi:periplasmic protein TonB